MAWITAAVAALALVAVATCAGMLLRSRSARVTAVATDDVLAPADLDVDTAFGSRATLVQFSTEFCARCPQTRSLLSAAAADRPGVRHIDVDLTHRPDLARRFSVLQTPTTLLIDAAGRVRTRIGGAPDPRTIAVHLDAITQGAS